MTIKTQMDKKDVDNEKIDAILKDVKEELMRATKAHGPFHSLHEAHSVILEELDELWDEIKKKSINRDKEKIRDEAIQVAAMGIRLILDLFEMKK